MDSCVKCQINGGGETMSSKVEKLDVPIWQRYTMTIDEAAAYFHIGRARLRALVSEDPYAPYILMVGNRVQIKRKLFEEYLDSANAVQLKQYINVEK